VKAETEAEAFRQRTLAEANKDTVGYDTQAEANKRRTLAAAEAEAEKVRAEGESQAKRHQADGDAYAERTVAAAEAEAINARAKALEDGNQALIAANKLVDALPALVEAAARGLAGSNLTVLNGSDGLGEVLTGLVGQGLSIYETLRSSVSAPALEHLNGTGPEADVAGGTVSGPTARARDKGV